MSKVKLPRHVVDVIEYLNALGIDPSIRHGKHYKLMWRHGPHHGHVILPSTPRDVGDSVNLAMQQIRRRIRASFT